MQENKKNFVISVVITCHNRKSKTLACLANLFSQLNLEERTISTYILDDGSTDGTSDSIQEEFPSVKLLKGNGNLFWNQGMNLAWQEALKQDPDFYLWLNDDTYLYHYAINHLLDTYSLIYKTIQKEVIIVGSTQDPQTQRFTYGGVKRLKFWHPLNFSNLIPTDQALECETMNGNCVLIPRFIVQKIGLLDFQFTHALGDFDYGLRATQGGCPVYIAPGYIGTCTLNKSEGTWKDETLSIPNRLKIMSQPKGMPWKEWRCFAQRHGDFFWFIYFILPYLKVFLTSFLNNKIFKLSE
jgi:GT2 family glycosyltransferase